MAIIRVTYVNPGFFIITFISSTRLNIFVKRRDGMEKIVYNKYRPVGMISTE